VPSFYLPAGKQPVPRCFLPFFAASCPGPTLPPPTGQPAAGSSGLSTKMMVHLSRYVGTRVAPGARKPTPLLPGVQWPSQTHVRPSLSPFPASGPGTTRCCTALLCYACCVPMRSAAHSGPAASFPAPVDSMQGRCKERSRCRLRPRTCASSLAARISSRLCHRKVPIPLRFLLSTLLMRMKKNATDRFMRDTIRCCYGAQGFLLLHHTMNDHRPVFSGNTVFGVFWPWSPFANHRRRADVMCFVVSEHVLYPEIQCASRSKEEVENW